MNCEIHKTAEKAVTIARLKNVPIAFAESCTGGLIGASVTDIPGASQVFMGSAVTYSNNAKINILKVPCSVIEQNGAVSSECAIMMAQGAAQIYSALLTISVTGIAGPDGGTDEKPVGTVWFGVCRSGETKSFVRHFTGTRNEIRESAAAEALQCVVKELS